MQVQFKVNYVPVFVRVVLPIALLGLCVAMVLLLNAAFFQSPVRATQGQMDLRDWDFASGPVLLGGEWAFHWNRYLEPDSVVARDWREAPAYITLPGVWFGMTIEGAPLPVLGSATLVLRMRLPPNRDFIVKVPTLTNRVRLAINTQWLIQDDLDQPHPSHRVAGGARLLAFDSGEGGQVTLVVHLLNDRHRAGGIWEPLLLADAAHQADLAANGQWLDVVTAFALSLAAVAIVVLSIRDQRWVLLFLALFSACMAVRAGTVNERMLFVLAGIQDWELQQLLEHLSLFASLPFFALYLGYRFPAYFPPLLHWVTAAVVGMLIALTLVTPPSVYSHTIAIIKVVAVVYAFLLLGALLEQVRLRERTAVWLLVGSLLFILATVNDILYTSNVIHSTNMTHVGALAFLLVAVVYRGEFVKRATLFERLEVVAPKPEATVPDHPLRALYQQFVATRQEDALRELTAQAMGCVLDRWEQCTGNGKLDFAEQSGLWRVTNDNGTLKTRTLDKYLRAASLPKNPRYKTVAQSLRYLIDEHPLSADDRYWLEQVAALYQQLD